MDQVSEDQVPHQEQTEFKPLFSIVRPKKGQRIRAKATAILQCVSNSSFITNGTNGDLLGSYLCDYIKDRFEQELMTSTMVSKSETIEAHLKLYSQSYGTKDTLASLLDGVMNQGYAQRLYDGFEYIHPLVGMATITLSYTGQSVEFWLPKFIREFAVANMANFKELDEREINYVYQELMLDAMDVEAILQDQLDAYRFSFKNQYEHKRFGNVEKYLRSIDNTVLERTIELTGSALAALETKYEDQFQSHLFFGPLTFMRGYAYALKNHPGNADMVRELFAYACRNRHDYMYRIAKRPFGKMFRQAIAIAQRQLDPNYKDRVLHNSIVTATVGELNKYNGYDKKEQTPVTQENQQPQEQKVVEVEHQQV